MRSPRLRPLAIIVGVSVTLGGMGSAFAGDTGAYFVHTTTADNTSFNSTTIETLMTDGNPAAIVHVTSRPDVGGGGAWNDHVVGVWYDDGSGNWKIFNQNFASSMPENTQFNVWVPPEDASSFVHTAAAGTITGNFTVIDNPLTNGLPGALLRVTQNFNPGGGGGFYNNHVIGVFYSLSTLKWNIFNQDIAAMPVGASFNITVLPDQPSAFVHTGAGGPNTEIDSPVTNDNPNAIVQITQHWNPPGGTSAVYNDHVVGVFYGYSRWWIFNQDLLDMTPGASFNVSAPSTVSTRFIHTADAGNTPPSANYTWLDDPLINANPNAILFVTHNWNPVGGLPTYNDHHLGVWYDLSESKWSVFNQDISGMPLDASFNVLVPAVDAATFVHTAHAPIGHYTVIDNPLLNNRPNAVVHVTQNWNPGDHGWIYNDHATGVFYNAGESKWSIFNQDLAAMSEDASFNVWIPPVDASTFVHTTASGNVSVAATFLDHPATNNNPSAVVVVTPNWNPGGVGGVYHNHAVGVYFDEFLQKWAIFNEDLANMLVGHSFNVTVFNPPFFSDGFESGNTSGWSLSVP